MENKELLTEKDLREIETIYQTQMDYKKAAITLNRVDFRKLLLTARMAIENK